MKAHLRSILVEGPHTPLVCFSLSYLLVKVMCKIQIFEQKPSGFSYFHLLVPSKDIFNRHSPLKNLPLQNLNRGSPVSCNSDLDCSATMATLIQNEKIAK